MVAEVWDTLHEPGADGEHWSTDNVGEAAPGVLTPFGWSAWGPISDAMPRRIAQTMGIFSSDDIKSFPAIVRPFYGRIAIQMEYLAAIGDRMPGTSGEAIIANMLGRVPGTMSFAATRRRYPLIACKLPIAMLAAPRLVRREAPSVASWWHARITTIPYASMAEAVSALREALAKFDETLTLHSLALMSVVQPLLVALTELIDGAGVGDVGALSGSGGAEMAIIEDIWKAARGTGSIDDVVSRHGFHGPLEGELSSHVWREDSAPLERMIASYRAVPDSESPLLRVRLAQERLPELQREVLAALPRRRRPAARLLLRIAARTIPLRGVGKRSYLQSLDVARCAGRRIGELLASEGTLASPDDVFYLTVHEVGGPLPDNVSELISLRRARRAEYQALDLPGNWQGTPVPLNRTRLANATQVISGIGASSGVTEGQVRVVLDPSFDDVQPNEILVTPTTDPSWASIMFLSAALVVDMGGMLSHAAVVARELGIPCVVNTRTGTHQLSTGDRVRVDGRAGTVEILERAEQRSSA
jgi:phosphohistidine swiveling domain-containing protein